MTDPFVAPDLLDALAARVAATVPRGRRRMVAVAGPPASGKSTLAAALAAHLTAGGTPAQCIPMDGFHLDDRVLTARGLLPRKGAPQTFDARGFVHAMARLRDDPEVILPEFDRSREIAIAGRIVCGPDVETAVIEGNYLCYDAEPWRDLDTIWDLSLFLDIPEPVLRARLIARWDAHGYDAQTAQRKIEQNDLPNARTVAARRRPVDGIVSDAGALRWL